MENLYSKCLAVEKHNNGVYTYVHVHDVPKEIRNEFMGWMAYQTFPVYEDDPNNLIVYGWDWERWVDLKFKGIPTYFD